jgi:hypothetical protein
MSEYALLIDGGRVGAESRSTVVNTDEEPAAACGRIVQVLHEYTTIHILSFSR